MEKGKAYKLNCYWDANEGAVVGMHNSTWEGNIILNEDNSVVGYATDAGKPMPTHLLIGTMIENIGLSICKIHANNTVYDPIIFDAFKNNNGKENTFYGCFYSRTPFNDIQLGISSIEIKEQPLSDNIKSNYEFFEKKIRKNGGFQAVLLDFLKPSDYHKEMTQNLIQFYESCKNEELPPELLTQSQPGEN